MPRSFVADASTATGSKCPCLVDLLAFNSALTSWSLRIEWMPVSPILRAIAERSLTVWDRKSATVINGFTLFSVRANNNYVVSVMPCIVREPVKRLHPTCPCVGVHRDDRKKGQLPDDPVAGSTSLDGVDARPGNLP